MSAVCGVCLVLACGVSTVETACSSTCAGCCTAAGECVAGTTRATCGVKGQACASCASPQICQMSACSAPGVGGGGGSAAGGGLGGGNPSDCSEAAKLVYVVDSDKTLSSFNPRNVGTNLPSFTSLGRLGCPAAAGAEPFSMSVDRNAIAWVIYDSGELFRVNVASPTLECTRTTFVPQQNVARFGMGFVSNTPGSTDETLFISGSPLTGSLTVTKFGTLSTTVPYAIAVRGALAGAPELTGTGDAKLWAFFPNVVPPRVAQLDKATGATIANFNAPQLAGQPLAWAFAFWGGDFWIFLQRTTDASTHVWKLTQSGAVSDALPDTGRRIVGAGVSTCAPVTIN